MQNWFWRPNSDIHVMPQVHPPQPPKTTKIIQDPHIPNHKNNRLAILGISGSFPNSDSLRLRACSRRRRFGPSTPVTIACAEAAYGELQDPKDKEFMFVNGWLMMGVNALKPAEMFRLWMQSVNMDLPWSRQQASCLVSKTVFNCWAKEVIMSECPIPGLQNGDTNKPNPS